MGIIQIEGEGGEIQRGGSFVATMTAGAVLVYEGAGVRRKFSRECCDTDQEQNEWHSAAVYQRRDNCQVVGLTKHTGGGG